MWNLKVLVFVDRLKLGNPEKKKTFWENNEDNDYQLNLVKYKLNDKINRNLQWHIDIHALIPDRIRIRIVGFCGGQKNWRTWRKTLEEGQEPTTNSTLIIMMPGQESHLGHTSGR